MPFDSIPSSRPIVLSSSDLASVYGLFAFAIGLTALGSFIGLSFAGVLFGTGIFVLMTIAELVIIFTSHWWSRSAPLNYILFAAFPFLSGITVTPYLMAVTVGYANGGAILLNALIATTLLSGAAAVFGASTDMNLGFLGRFLFFGLIGLIIFSVLQIFIPALQMPQTEVIVSGFGVVLFGLFLAYDVQRIQTLARIGASPFLLALSLYLDIFNLFLMILRFMSAVSGRRE
jgi:modulator of FtsH protease